MLLHFMAGRSIGGGEGEKNLLTAIYEYTTPPPHPRTRPKENDPSFFSWQKCTLDSLLSFPCMSGDLFAQVDMSSGAKWRRSKESLQGS